MGRQVDFEAEGLLAGLETDEERAARRELLVELLDSGAELEELKRAVAEERLALLPTELFLRRGSKYTLAEVAERAGLEESFVLADWLALGLSRPAPDDAVFTDADVEGFSMLRQVMEAGLSEDAVIALARVFGQTSAQAAAAVAETFAETFLRPGLTERDLGLQFSELTSNLSPVLGPLVENAVRLHLREHVAHQLVDRASLVAGRLPGARPMAVGFADLVGFTKLSEASPTEKVGELARRFGELAADVAEPPVRLVKLLGDGAMLASQDPGALVEAAATLLESRRSADLPEMRVGLAHGEALSRGGDLYGRTVNTASRICDVAPPGEVASDEELKELTGARFRWEHLEDAELEGIAEPVPIYALRGSA